MQILTDPDPGGQNLRIRIQNTGTATPFFLVILCIAPCFLGKRTILVSHTGWLVQVPVLQRGCRGCKKNAF
jgi:hypothetical protein